MNGTVPPPRPSSITAPKTPQSVNEHAAFVNERRSTCDHPRTSVIVIRWDAVLTAIAALVIGIAIGLSVAGIIMPAVAAELDPFNGVPACTDEIADAGGICHGEPR